MNGLIAAVVLLGVAVLVLLPWLAWLVEVNSHTRTKGKLLAYEASRAAAAEASTTVDNAVSAAVRALGKIPRHGDPTTAEDFDGALDEAREALRRASNSALVVAVVARMRVNDRWLYEEARHD